MKPPFEGADEQFLRDPRPFYERISSSIRKRGWLGTAVGALLYTRMLCRSWSYDMTHHVSTCRQIPTSRLGIAGASAPHALCYEASDAGWVRRLLRQLDIDYERFEFIDLGAGKGRSLFVAAEFPFRRIVGLELSQGLAQLARRNCSSLRSKSQACRNLEVVCGDAAEFRFPDGPLVVYLYNPFSGFILERVVQELERSWSERPRDIFVIYTNPVYSRVFEASSRFHLFSSSIDLLDPRKLLCRIYRTRPGMGPARNPATFQVGYANLAIGQPDMAG